MANKINRAKSAKTETAKRVNNRRRSAKDTAVEAVPVVEAVEAVEVQIESDAAAALPVATETTSGKVSSKDVLKAAGSLRAAVKEERRGANVTIRLIAERAANGDTDAVNILCALCDVPRSALFSLNLEKIRAAVNAWYPYYMEVDNRRVSAKPVGVWYSTANHNEQIESAAKRVQRGYRAAVVSDYLDMLIKAAKSRAKGVTPRRVDADAIYNDIALSDAAEGIAATEIDEAKERKAYLSGAANVWKKDRNGFYI